MCGRYTIFTDEDERELLEIIRIVNEKYRNNGTNGSQLYKTGEIFPSERVPLLVGGKGTGFNAVLANWGFTLNSNQDAAISSNRPSSQLVINARSETVTKKPLFKNSFFERRCIIPSTGFYEWDKGKTKKKYHFRLPAEGTLYMAGIWRKWEYRDQFTILTTAANPSVSDIHHRMPVILHRESFRDWFTDTNKAKTIIAGEMPLLDRYEAI